LEEALAPNFDPYYITNEGTGYDDPLYGFFGNGEKRQALTIPFVLGETRRRH
jgi:hypothetical protein